MSCSDLILEAAVELFISFGSFFLHLTQPMKSTLALSLSLSVCLSLSFLCFVVCVYHGLTFSRLKYKHTYALNMQGRQSGGLEWTLQ